MLIYFLFVILQLESNGRLLGELNRTLHIVHALINAPEPLSIYSKLTGALMGIAHPTQSLMATRIPFKAVLMM